jgi:hypothetical protein
MSLSGAYAAIRYELDAVNNIGSVFPDTDCG